jgi:hypothetical protein
MGAGTLDLTLVSLKTGEGVTTIDYKAKVGVNKAGNYLDYLIAEILKEFYKKSSSATENGLELISKAINYNTTLGGAAATSLRKELKDFVKDNVKKSFASSVWEGKGPLKAPLPSHDSVLPRDAALQEIGKIAPPIDNRHYSMEDLQFYDECHMDDDDTSVIDELVTDFERNGATNTRKPLEQYLADVGDEMFRRAWFRFDTDVYKAQKAEKPFDNPAGVFLGRLKRLKTALQSLRQ